MEALARGDLTERAEELGWYHTLDLPGSVTTNGMVDLRGVVDRYGLPERMDGMRALDIGTWDGFWAFEMERRGADVVALDIEDEREMDWPPRRRPTEWPEQRRGDGFRLAHEALGSSVERVVCNIYDAKPEDLGTFDLVFCGTMLLHLRDQLLALERIANLTRGTFVSAEEYDLLASLIPFPVTRYFADRDKAVVYWLPALKTWKRMLWTAGFDRVVQHGKFRLPSTRGWSLRHVVLHACVSSP